MSSRDYYKRQALPPIRDVLGDQLDCPPHSAYSFDAVQRALPSAPPRSGGPTLPPIHPEYAPDHGHASSRGSHASSHSSSHTSAHTHGSSHSSSRPADAHYSSHSSSRHPPASASAPYSFDVFRPTSSGLVHAAASDRAQGILRSTRADAGVRGALPPTLGEDDEKRYACPACGKRFSRPSSLRTHEVVHSEAKPYECPHPGCGKTFTVPSNMRRHFRKMHEEGGGGVASGEDEPEDAHYHHHSHAPASASYYSSSRR